MTNSGVDISDDLIIPREQMRASSWMPPSGAQIAWDEMDLLDWDAHIENPPEPKKVGKIKVLLRHIRIGKDEVK